MSGYAPAMCLVFDALDAAINLMRGLPPRATDEEEEIAASAPSQAVVPSGAGSGPRSPPPPPQRPRKARPPRLSLPPSVNAPPSPQGKMHLASLPPELHILILQHLAFADIQRLRHASRLYRTLITKRLLRGVYGASLKSILLSHCHVCHASDLTRASLLLADQASPSYPFCSTCVPCAARRDQFVPARRVAMGDLKSVWVCRWCGMPVLGDNAHADEPLFHRPCYSRYGGAQLLFLLLGWAQLCVGITGAALCLRYFRGVNMVLGPCIVYLVLVPVALLKLNARCPADDRTYMTMLAMELVLLGLWIPPTYAVASGMGSGVTRKATLATLVFCGFNLTFRLLNVMGNSILATEPPLWRRRKPGLSVLARVGYYLVAVLAFWTYPRAVEQSYTPLTKRARRLYNTRSK